MHGSLLSPAWSPRSGGRGGRAGALALHLDRVRATATASPRPPTTATSAVATTHGGRPPTPTRGTPWSAVLRSRTRRPHRAHHAASASSRPSTSPAALATSSTRGPAAWSRSPAPVGCGGQAPRTSGRSTRTRCRPVAGLDDPTDTASLLGRAGDVAAAPRLDEPALRGRGHRPDRHAHHRHADRARGAVVLRHRCRREPGPAALRPRGRHPEPLRGRAADPAQRGRRRRRRVRGLRAADRRRAPVCWVHDADLPARHHGRHRPGRQHRPTLHGDRERREGARVRPRPTAST